MREQGMFDPAHLVFVDETAANTKMVRLSGRCPRGERLIGRVPQGHWKTITFVAALRRNGMRAPCTVDGSMNGARFLAYVEQCLAPILKRKDIVMIDNLPAHKAAGIREAIEARGATLRYLPQYSPDLNPIEMPFSKLKASLRKAAERTIPRLRRRIARFACTLTAREACNYFRHAGYEGIQPESALGSRPGFATTREEAPRSLVEAVMRRSAVQKMTVAAIDIKPDASSPPRPESTRGQATLCAVRVMR